MRPVAVIERQVGANILTGSGDGVVSCEINLLVLDAFPEPLDEGVIAPAVFAIHADFDPVGDEQIGVEDFRRAETGDRFQTQLPDLGLHGFDI